MANPTARSWFDRFGELLATLRAAFTLHRPAPVPVEVRERLPRRRVN